MDKDSMNDNNKAQAETSPEQESLNEQPTEANDDNAVSKQQPATEPPLTDDQPSADQAAEPPLLSEAKEEPSAEPEPSAKPEPSAEQPPVKDTKTADTIAPSTVDEPANKAAKSQVEEPKRSFSKLAVLALVLTLVALVGLWWGFTQLQKLQIQQDQQVNNLKEQLQNSDAINRTLQQQNGQILGELKQVRSTAKQHQQNVDQLQNRLAKAMQQISKVGTDTRKDWLLAEVEYLLRLANQRVQLERTATGALSLLRSADQILKETDDVSIYPVRKALAQDLLKLEAVPQLDVDGLFIKLVAINSEVDNLHLLPITDKHQLPDLLKRVTPETVTEGWQEGLEASWANAMDKLGKLIVIRHRDDPVTPLLSPEQHYFLTQNLHLMLEQTQLALLQGKQEAYDAGLAKAKAWIQTYFRQNDSITQALVDNLSQLQGINIAPKLPDISDSLKALKAYLTELHNLEGSA